MGKVSLRIFPDYILPYHGFVVNLQANIINNVYEVYLWSYFNGRSNGYDNGM